MFPSRRGGKAISPTQVYRQLNKAGVMVDIDVGIGNHTLRKTFGYWFCKQNKDTKLQMILNHSHPQVTKRYTGITQDEIEESLSNFSL